MGRRGKELGGRPRRPSFLSVLRARWLESSWRLASGTRFSDIFALCVYGLGGGGYRVMWRQGTVAPCVWARSHMLIDSKGSSSRAKTGWDGH